MKNITNEKKESVDDLQKEAVKRLKKLRIEWNHTQEYVAKKLSISKSTYNAIENLKRKLQFEDVKILKDVYNINPNWLMFGDGEKEYAKNISELEISKVLSDFEEYGGDRNILKKEIIRKILKKMFKNKKILNIEIPKTSHKYFNRVYFTLANIIQYTSFNGFEYEAKNYFIDCIQEYTDNSMYLSEVKKELYMLTENINCKDCNYILNNKDISINLINERISAFDKKINSMLI